MLVTALYYKLTKLYRRKNYIKPIKKNNMKKWIFTLVAIILIYAITAPVFNIITVIGISLILSAFYISSKILHARSKRK
jgi:drug/metabolite transporter (DMT)-like permease